MTFNVGDTVILASGGPVMTVEEVGDGYVHCTWFSKGAGDFEGPRSAQFDPAMLRASKPTPTAQNLPPIRMG
ncbi:hypothetical protein GCM10007907_24970 [Chitinimonas prasina]|uniref:DUF2158 domain-containing protein n=1 Tax=Chitinimonas prasina TaxID=1434937 RepID=A0ABQ5YJ61_9NEIS|nr:hypothetical protein GCM10007907_24970 [Chitinimonas prasina]